MRKKQRLGITLRLWNKDREVVNTTLYIKDRILAAAQVTFQQGYIKVTYPLGVEYYNDATFTDFKRLKKLLSLFTEESLVKDFS